MRTELEIRAAIATLERLAACPASDGFLCRIRGRIVGLKFALNEDTRPPNLESLLEKVNALFAEIDAMNA